MRECARACARGCVQVSECVCVHVFVCTCVCACVCACMHTSVKANVCDKVYFISCITTAAYIACIRVSCLHLRNNRMTPTDILNLVLFTCGSVAITIYATTRKQELSSMVHSVISERKLHNFLVVRIA